MESALNWFLRVCKVVLNVIGSAALAFMMFLTVADILLRAVGHPLVGTYEMVGLIPGAGDRVRHPPRLHGAGPRLHGDTAGEALSPRQGHNEHLHPHPVHRSFCPHSRTTSSAWATSSACRARSLRPLSCPSSLWRTPWGSAVSSSAWYSCRTS